MSKLLLALCLFSSASAMAEVTTCKLKDFNGRVELTSGKNPYFDMTSKLFIDDQEIPMISTQKSCVTSAVGSGGVNSGNFFCVHTDDTYRYELRLKSDRAIAGKISSVLVVRWGADDLDRTSEISTDCQ